MRGPGPLATNPILFLCVSRILLVVCLRKSEHFYRIKYHVSRILILMSMELSEMCRMIHVMSLNHSLREGARGQIAPGPQGPRGLITPNASSYVGAHKVNQQ